MDRMNWINLAYLVAGLGFVFSLKWMTAASTARRGVLAGEIGFGIAIVATLFWPGITTEGYILIAVAALIGSAIGIPLGLLVPMTAMPQRTPSAASPLRWSVSRTTTSSRTTCRCSTPACSAWRSASDSWCSPAA